MSMQPAVQSNAEVQQLFLTALENSSAREVARLLGVQIGTVDRWIRTREVPPFYKNDLLRILGKPCAVGIYESDQFYTMPKVAQFCMSQMKRSLRKYGVTTNRYTFVEPSAGCGHFYNLLPKVNASELRLTHKNRR